jgi:hypothetical protein
VNAFHVTGWIALFLAWLCFNAWLGLTIADLTLAVMSRG